jgi:hypothetical protein
MITTKSLLVKFLNVSCTAACYRVLVVKHYKLNDTDTVLRGLPRHKVFVGLNYKVLFRRVRRIAKSGYYLHVCLSAWNNSSATGRISMKFDIRGFFENLLRKFKFH